MSSIASESDLRADEQAVGTPAIPPTWYFIASLISGLLLSACFPPLSWSFLVWLAFIPLLLIPPPSSWGLRLLVGYFWGYVHAASSLLWLNEVGFGAGWLLSLYCALYPMLWYFLFSAATWWLRQSPAPEYSGAGLLYIHALPRTIFLCFFAASSWCALEWLRSWLFTGFPWNQLGISQYQCVSLLQSAAYLGVYGLSFLIVFVNMSLSVEFCQALRRKLAQKGRRFTWHLLLCVLLFVPVLCWNMNAKMEFNEESEQLMALVVQGDIPQCRNWTEQEFQQALQVYTGLTREEALLEPRPDLVVWPESAVPAAIDYPEYAESLRQLQDFTQTPLLLGATNYRQDPVDPEEYNLFNSAFLLDAKARVINYYDKIHPVPFGEYVPGSKYWPWLVELIGMGRDLSSGSKYTVFDMPKGAKAGVNICFEDVFPEISRRFTQRGANLLFTITNDSWYNQSAGSKQHLSHVVFRAVENRRPLLRSGSNSDTCMISPRGEILGIMRDPKSGSYFTRGAMRFALPVRDDWGETFYTRYGNLFAACCVIFTTLSCAALFGTWFNRKKKLFEEISA
ncbi:MAG: apolipoprotein N-acyltransferase [Oligosphaeraceae bacterium]|nr:apolipoprotein N-acyltransferase [Oligosphaeraceae bacterium]